MQGWWTSSGHSSSRFLDHPPPEDYKTWKVTMILSQILLFYLNERKNETLCKLYFWYSIFKLDRSLQFHPWKSKALLCVRFKFPMSNMCCPHVLGLVWCTAVSSLVSWREQRSSVVTSPRILVSRGRQHNDHTPQQCCCCGWAAAVAVVVVTSHPASVWVAGARWLEQSNMIWWIKPEPSETLLFPIKELLKVLMCAN